MVRKLIGALEVKARRRRYELFVRLLSLVTRPITILDVGGLLKYWRTVDVTSLSVTCRSSF